MARPEQHQLHQKDPKLQTTRRVARAVARQEQGGEKVPNSPSKRIDAYLKRLERLVLDPTKEQKGKDMGDILHTERPRALSLLREMVLNEYVRPNKEAMAAGAARVEGRAAHQAGIEVAYGREQLAQRGEIAVGDLESSLDQWITYLSDPNEPYPMWFRYYTFRNILDLGEYDKDKQDFPARSKGTFKLFPDVDRGALAYVQEMMEASQDDVVLERIRDAQKSLWATPEEELLTKEKAHAFAKLSFAKQYAEGIKQNGEISEELRAITEGEWKKYKQGTDPKELWLSLQNKGTAWCTKGYPTAKTQLLGGDFHVFYTFDATGKPTIPRIAIRMEGDRRIAEDPRGVFDSKQNIEGNMIPELEKKLSTFGAEADIFRKKSADMKRLTRIEKEIQDGTFDTKEDKEELRADLIFLYELEGTIKGFGYGEIPWVKELRDARDPEKDMPILFGCAPEEIVHSAQELQERIVEKKPIQAYVGPLENGIFGKDGLPRSVEYVYAKFPGKRILLETERLGDGPRDGKAFEKAIQNTVVNGQGMQIYRAAKEVLHSPEFIVSAEGDYDIVELSVEDLGFTSNTRYDKICERAKELGLELCPPDMGPSLRLKDTSARYRIVAMNPLNDSDGYPYVFDLDGGDDGLWLNAYVGRSDIVWDPERRFVFLRPRPRN